MDFSVDVLSDTRLTSVIDDASAVLRRTDLGLQLSKYITLGRFEEMLWLADQHDPKRIQISRDGLARADERIDIMRSLPRVLNENYSVVLNYAERFDPKLAVLANDVSHVGDGVVNLAIFLAPAGYGAFGAHFDNLDVYAVQLHGKKIWNLGSEASLPRYKANLEDGHKLLDRSEVLSVGDLLYVPRGLPHSVQACGSEFSLHVSIALNPVKWADVLQGALKTRTECELRIRRRFSFDNLSEEPIQAEFGKLAAQQTRHSLRRIKGKLRQNQICAMRQPPGGVIKRALQENKITCSDRVKFRRGVFVSIMLADDGGTVLCGFPGLVPTHLSADEIQSINDASITRGSSQLTFPIAALSALEYISRNGANPVLVANLPGPLNDDSKALLVGRLVRDGVLEQC